MIDGGKDFAQSPGVGSKCRALGLGRTPLELSLGALVALIGCGVLTWVWHIAGNENHHHAITAVRALDQARHSSERVEAIRDLVRSDVIDYRVAIPPLIRSLADAPVEVRVEAARSLGQAAAAAALISSGNDHAKAAIAALTGSLDDREPAVRIAAVHALGSIAAARNPWRVIHPQTLVGALSAMLGDPDASVRASTIVSLGVAGPVAAPDPPPALIASLDDESSFNRAATVRTLARFQLRADPLIPKLLALLEKEEDGSPVEGECVEVLRHIDHPRILAAALPALRAGLASRDRRVRFEAASLLKRLGPDDQPGPPNSVFRP